MECGLNSVIVRGSHVEQALAWMIGSVDKTRKVLTKICCDGECLAATDSRVLVYSRDALGLAPGLYDLRREARSYVYERCGQELGRYPNWRSVIPKGMDGISPVTWDFSAYEGDWMNDVYREFYRKGAFLKWGIIEMLRKTKARYEVRTRGGDEPWLISSGSLSILTTRFSNAEGYKE